MPVPFEQALSDAAGGSLVAPARRRLALLTGQSMPSNVALSPQQIAFLAAVAPPGVEVLAHGFPYHRAFETGGYQAASMLTASLHNARQFLAAATSQRFRAVVAARIDELIGKTREQLILLTGSCGLQLLNAAWPALQARPRPAIHIVALGPTQVGPLALPHGVLTTVQGRDDPWSRWLFTGRVDHRIACGHLDYWSSDEAADLVRRLLASNGAR